MYESISNLSIEEAEKILNDDITLEKEISKQSINYDFLFYLQSNYIRLENDRKKSLLILSLKKLKSYRTNAIVNYIIQEKYKEISMQEMNSQDDLEKMKKWNLILEKNNFDFSQKLYFLKKCLNIGFRSISQMYPNLNLKSSGYTNAIRKDFYLLTYLSQNFLFHNFKYWDKQVWENLNNLSVEQYLSVLTDKLSNS
ncbi:hypothetical protein AB996_1188 [Lactococcus cremoris]|uniref:Uncharacterized protein n=1 Tax=Lactococcus lactis subsp. cremoris TaxID=1359 RepID=A0A161U036_LACLC|nr:hypothetical protein [Lactococcus cremoris]KZK06412.1 hypothetical protein AB996_1188 [Lactococcus cremoris]